MLRTALLIGLLVIGIPSRAAETSSESPHEALAKIVKQPDVKSDAHACKIDATVDFELYKPRLAIFREAWLNRDYSVDFYALREKQVLIYIILKRVAEMLTEARFGGQDSPECKFSLSVEYTDKFGQSKSLRALNWRFNNEQSHKINWEKFDPRNFHDVALDYELSKETQAWTSDEPDMATDKKPAKADDCDMYMFKANAIFIRATTFCSKNYMDSKAGYAALDEARRCAASMPEEDMEPQVKAAMESVDRMVRQRGRAAACAMIENIAQNINRKRQ
jgi:hypothetical protein